MALVVDRLTDLAGFLIRSSALVLVLALVSRLPALRTVFYRRDLSGRGRVWYVAFWTLASVLAPRLTVASAYVPFFAGVFGSEALGGTVGFASGLWILAMGWSAPAATGQLVAGLAGGRLGRKLGPGRRLPNYLAVVAGALSMVGMDQPDHPGIWLPLALLGGGPMAWLVPGPYLLLAFSLGSFAFMRLMEYLLTESDRERAHAADRVLALASDAERILEQGLNAEAASGLAHLVQTMLEVPACFVAFGAEGFAFAGQWPHRGLHPNAASGEHRASLDGCPSDCGYTLAHLVALQDVGVLGVLGTASAALPPSAAETLQGLGTLLSAHLSASRLQQQKADLESARFRFLQAQIQPHFLFNALNTVAALTTREPVLARAVVLNLSRVLRESFRQDRPLISLADDLEVVRAYLAVEQARFGDRLRITMDVPDPPPDVQVPPFTVQPLLENAVRHGIGPQVDGGEVVLRIRIEGAWLHIDIEDTGAGMSPGRVAEVLARQAEGIGVSNVCERLATVYRGAAQFSLESVLEQGTMVHVRVPCCP